MIEALIGIAVFIAVVVFAFIKGKSNQRNEDEVDELNEYIATKKRIEDATRRDLSDADVDDSLRDHAKR
jgi:cbb3-type cytochrome oxidase subunit 3